MIRLITACAALTALCSMALAGEERTLTATVGGFKMSITKVMDDEKPAPARYRINSSEDEVLAEIGINRLTLQQAFIDYSDRLKQASKRLNADLRAMRNPHVVQGRIVEERDEEVDGLARKVIRLDNMPTDFALIWDIHDFGTTDIGTRVTLRYLAFSDGTTFVLDVR